MATKNSKILTAREAVKLALDFMQSTVEPSQMRVEGMSFLDGGGWAVEISAYVANPSLSVRRGDLKSDLLDEFTYVVSMDTTGNVHGMSKA